MRSKSIASTTGSFATIPYDRNYHLERNKFQLFDSCFLSKNRVEGCV
jgi:hypothetical protein